jgi:carbamoyltransferase
MTPQGSADRRMRLGAGVLVGKFKQSERFGPRHPVLARMAFRAALPIAERFFRQKHIHRSAGNLAHQKSEELTARIRRGEKAYLAGINMGGFHNTGVALVEVSREAGLRIICNNEEERFSLCKHASHYPTASLKALSDIMSRLGIGPQQIVAWLATYDYPLFTATGVRTLVDEFPGSLNLAFEDGRPTFDLNQFREGTDAPTRLANLFDLPAPVPIIGIEHHDCHAWFSYLASPFARDPKPVMIAVVDGSGDFASLSLYIGENGNLRRIRDNASIFDSLGMFYSVISSTQGGWTPLSSEGRYMGAAAYGEMDRNANRFYPELRKILSLEPNGDVRLNRRLANWPRFMFRKPYTRELIEILGEPIPRTKMWNPDAIIRVEDIRYHPSTQERVDKAAATQMVLEDGLVHIVDRLIRGTGSDRLVLTGGTALNAVANMRLLENFNEDYYRRMLRRSTRLHLWIPPIPGDAGAPVGAAYAFAGAAGAGFCPGLQHAFYCGRAATLSEIRQALDGAPDVAWTIAGDASDQRGVNTVADLMAYITARDGIIGIVQGPAETGPRALGHRSIVANARNPYTRDLLNQRVKYREPIRPLAPMATLVAAKQLFELSDGASDDEYNAYNYMVITVRATLRAHQLIPAVIHVDGTARLQIVRERTDPIAYAYLKALGRRCGVEVAVNTSYNVAAPIAQSPVHVIETLDRANGMDGVFIFSSEGPVVAAWTRYPKAGDGGKIEAWLTDWGLDTGIRDPSTASNLSHSYRGGDA